MFLQKGRLLGITLIFSLWVTGIAQTLTVLTHDSFAISEDVITAFTEQTGINIEFIAGGDAGETINRAILTKNNPIADLLYGVDNNLIARASQADIFEPYVSPKLAKVNPDYRFSELGEVTPIDAGYVNFNLDKAYFSSASLGLPADITDLTMSDYAGLTVLQNPSTSSPGLAFMLATIDRFGTSGEYTWLNYWADLRDNDLMIVSGWSDAYYAAFSIYGGDRPIVLSYASSPAAEVIFAETELDDAPTANLFCEKCVFEQIEAVGILRKTKNLDAARQFIDYMLSDTFQTDIAPNMFVYPSVKGIVLPQEFDQYSLIPTSEERARLEPSFVEENLKTWLSQWTQVVEQGRNPDSLK